MKNNADQRLVLPDAEIKEDFPNNPFLSRGRKNEMTKTEKLKNEANEALRQHQYSQARKLYTDLLHHTGENHIIYCNRAAAFMGLNMYQEAFEDSQRAIGLSPEWAKGYNMKALALTKLERPNDAFAVLCEGLRILPTNTILLNALRTLVLSGIPMNETDYLPDSSQFSPLILPFMCGLCQQLFFEPVTLSCGHTFCKSCFLDCHKQDVCPQCNHVLDDQSNDLRINIVLTNVIEKAFPTQALLSMHLKSAAELRNHSQPELALEQLNSAFRLDPNCQLALVQMCDICLDLHRFDDAEAASQSAQALIPTNGRGQLGRALVALSNKNFSKALTLCLESYRCCPVLRRPQDLIVRCVAEQILARASLTLADISSCDVCLRPSPEDQMDGVLVAYQHNFPPPNIEAAKSELECQLCLTLYHEPFTTPCGHTFCKICLSFALEKNPKCPMCRAECKQEKFSQRSIDFSLKTIAQQFFPTMYQERSIYIQNMLALETTDVPIFVCALAFPKVPCPLHIFEPRYKLMMQRCLALPRPRFGMCVPLQQGGFSDVGVMLDIRETQTLPNGNLLIDTIGTKRFRVSQRGVKDQYNIGNIEYIEDEADDGRPDAYGCTLQQYVEKGTEIVRTTTNGFSPENRQRFSTFYGEAPSDPSTFSLWLLAIIPMDEQEKMRCLTLTNTKERFRIICKELQQKSSTRGCIIS